MITESIIDKMIEKNKKPENPVTFPHGYGTDFYERAELGMSLRDYFAAKAMQAMICNNSIVDIVNRDVTEYVSIRSYLFADDMLKARENDSI